VSLHGLIQTRTNGFGLDGREIFVPFSERAKIFPFFLNRPDCLASEPKPVSYTTGTAGAFLGGEAAGT
jgi:hypothetical protein